MRIGEYLMHLRIERAKTLLMHTDIPSSSIATRIGISSQQYFCEEVGRRVSADSGRSVGRLSA